MSLPLFVQSSKRPGSLPLVFRIQLSPLTALEEINRPYLEQHTFHNTRPQFWKQMPAKHR